LGRGTAGGGDGEKKACLGRRAPVRARPCGGILSQYIKSKIKKGKDKSSSPTYLWWNPYSKG